MGGKHLKGGGETAQDLSEDSNFGDDETFSSSLLHIAHLLHSTVCHSHRKTKRDAIAVA